LKKKIYKLNNNYTLSLCQDINEEVYIKLVEEFEFLANLCNI